MCGVLGSPNTMRYLSAAQSCFDWEVREPALQLHNVCTHSLVHFTNNCARIRRTIPASLQQRGRSRLRTKTSARTSCQFVQRKERQTDHEQSSIIAREHGWLIAGQSRSERGNTRALVPPAPYLDHSSGRDRTDLRSRNKFAESV